MKKNLIVGVALVASIISTEALAKKYYVHIGCHPDYKLHRVGCEVGTTWQACARDFCYNQKLSAAPGGQPSLVAKPPKLLGPLPPDYQASAPR